MAKQTLEQTLEIHLSNGNLQADWQMAEGLKSKSNGTLLVDKNLLMPDPNQPRRRITQEEINKKKRQLRASGQVSPITIRKDTIEDFGVEKFMIVDGETRWRSALQLEEITHLWVLPEGEETPETSDEEELQRMMIQLLSNDHSEVNDVNKCSAYNKIIDLNLSTGKAKTQHEAKLLTMEELGFDVEPHSNGYKRFSKIINIKKNIPPIFFDYANENGISDAEIFASVRQLKKASSLDKHKKQKKILGNQGQDIVNVWVSEIINILESDLIAVEKRHAVREFVKELKSDGKKPKKTVKKKTITAKESSIKEDGDFVVVVTRTASEEINNKIPVDVFWSLVEEAKK